ALQATDSIPIVFAMVDDPVAAGLVNSYARPGGNVTGVADANTVLAPKRLEIFSKVVPSLKRVMFLYDGGDPDSVKQARVYREAGGRLGVEVLARPVGTEAEAQAILAKIGNGGIDGILSPVTVYLNIPGLVLEAATRHGIPTMFPGAFWLDQGALSSYAPSFYSSGLQAARLVDKIIRGVKPRDIPVEVNNKIEFAISLKVAKTLGIKISPEVLYQADRIDR
ncbi:MAG: ABC transporter substrate-binding protein, partial [SAR324 cluster bacterium]|nr:ABC transporter substrate-binding protein [SAR324 cluster bacterium]